MNNHDGREDGFEFDHERNLEEARVQSLGCLELIDALEPGGEALIALDVHFDDHLESAVSMARTIRVNRARALALIRQHAPTLARTARATMCVIGVPSLRVALSVDGAPVVVEVFPERAARLVAPIVDALYRALRSAEADEQNPDAETRRVAPRASAAAP